MKTDPREWTIELGRDGYYIVDEYGEDHGWLSEDYKTALAMLSDIVAEEIAAYDEEQWERAQERLMETGGGPSLQEQQIIARRFK